jgi:hypothetical protein
MRRWLCQYSLHESAHTHIADHHGGGTDIEWGNSDEVSQFPARTNGIVVAIEIKGLDKP